MVLVRKVQGKRPVGKVDIDGRVTLKWIFKRNSVWGHGLNCVSCTLPFHRLHRGTLLYLTACIITSLRPSILCDVRQCSACCYSSWGPHISVQYTAINISISQTVFKESAGNIFIWVADVSHLTNKLSLHVKVLLYVRRDDGRWLVTGKSKVFPITGHEGPEGE